MEGEQQQYDDFNVVNADAETDTAICITAADVSAAHADADGCNGKTSGD